jgi:hypothetical protein
MSRRAAIISQADVARALRAARQAGAAFVEVQPDGTIRIRLDDVPPPKPANDNDDEPPVVL